MYFFMYPCISIKQISSAVVISSSCSTDETVVADSDVEAETATSVDISVDIKPVETTKHETDHAATRLGSDNVTCSSGRDYDTTAHKENEVEKLESVNADIGSSDQDNIITARRDHVDEPESGNPDIIYSQTLIVRDTNLPASDYSSTDNGVPNFKCFKKVNGLHLYLYLAVNILVPCFLPVLIFFFLLAAGGSLLTSIHLSLFWGWPCPF